MAVHVAAAAPSVASSSSGSHLPAVAGVAASSSRLLLRRAGCFARSARLEAYIFSLHGGARGAGAGVVRRAVSAGFEGFAAAGDGDDGEDQRPKRLPLPGHDAAAPWVPASLERSAAGLPVSLRMLKRKKKRWEAASAAVDGGGGSGAGESACMAVQNAFASMMFIVRELHSFVLQARRAAAAMLEEVHADVHASFIWLFQHVFASTPALMISVMLLLANFTVYSMGHTVAHAAAPPPPAAAAAAIQQQDQALPWFDPSSAAAKMTFPVGKTAAVGGVGDGGGKAPLVAGATDDGRSGESFDLQTSTVVNQESSSSSSDDGTETDMAAAVWEKMIQEARRMRGIDDSLMHVEFVAPVEAAPEADDHAAYVEAEQRYRRAIAADPNNSLLLSNFAQFLFVVLRDHDRAEQYFKRAVRGDPVDAEAMGRYAAFLWRARGDLAGAEEAYQDAIAAEPANTHHAAAYANFLWSTGGDETCFPLL